MVNLRLPTLGLAIVASLAASTAHAADMPLPPPIPEVGGWYLRGDIGFSNQNVGSLFNVNYAGFDSVTNINKRFDAAPLFGLGIGYIVNNWLRFDFTGEYRGAANFHGYDIATSGGVIFPDLYNSSKSEWTFMFNGYVDLGTWYNLTPFVGVGIGTSRNTISNFTDISACVGGCGNPGANAFGATASQWNFAWALHAGLAYRVSPNFTVELAYRYIDLGNAKSGDLIGFDGTNNSYNPMEFHRLTSSDVKLGLRFNLDSLYDSLRPVQYYPPPPLRSKG